MPESPVRLTRGDVAIERLETEEGVWFEIKEDGRSRFIVIEEGALRWLCFQAGPAMLAGHAPPPLSSGPRDLT